MCDLFVIEMFAAVRCRVSAPRADFAVCFDSRAADFVPDCATIKLTMAAIRAGLRKAYLWGPVQNFLGYLKQLAVDYKSVALDIAKDSRDRPLKATIYGSGVVFLFV